MGELILKSDYKGCNPVPPSSEVNHNAAASSLVQHLQSLVTCPVCLGTIRAVPVLCCPSGHVTCSDCRAQLSSCPVCRAAYPRLELVSHIAAGIIDQIPHPCKYAHTSVMLVVIIFLFKIQVLWLCPVPPPPHPPPSRGQVFLPPPQVPKHPLQP